MISILEVENFALIQKLTLKFEKGFNVITGETGAGKSLLISSIKFLLGEKYDNTFIRTGAEYASVQGVFDISNEIVALLSDFCMCEDNQIIISRKLFQNNKTEIRINGQLVTLTTLKKITPFIIDLSGQHQQQTLLSPQMHLYYLDEFIGTPATQSKNLLKSLFEQRHKITKQIIDLGGDEIQRERERQMLEYQVEEITKAGLSVGEEAELLTKKNKIDNLQKVLEGLNFVLDCLNGNEDNYNGCLVNIKNSIKSLLSLSSIDKTIEALQTRLVGVDIELRDIYDSLESLKESYDFNEYEFRELTDRLEMLQILKKKYGPTEKDILNYLHNAESRLSVLEASEITLSKYQKELATIDMSISQIANTFSELRREKAKELEKLLLNQLVDLGMPKARFVIEFNQVQAKEQGCDDIVFLFSANEGESLKPLTTIISGGEMSRFMLAFKVVINQKDFANTLVFDEIDNGIGGVVGVAVAKKLTQISHNIQLIVITHLATIASFGDVHFKIEKIVKSGKTETNICKLNPQEIILELARLTSGDSETPIAVQHALELKKRAKDIVL